MGEEFSERGPNFLNYVQHIFSEGEKFFLLLTPVTGLCKTLGQLRLVCV